MSDDRVRISKRHSNPDGQRIRGGGMTLVNCMPECDAEFRSGSDDKVIHAQLERAGWQVTEVSDHGKKSYRYRCPNHRVVIYSALSGTPLEPPSKLKTGKEKKQGGRMSHDGGDE